MENVYRILDFAGVLISVVCCYSVLRENESKNQKYLLMTFICGLLITIGDMFEFTAKTPDAAMVGIKIAYIGKCFIMLFALQFATGFCRIRFSKNIINFMLVLDVLIINIIMTCEHHTLYYSAISYKVIESSNRVCMIFERGPFYFIWLAEFFFGVFWFAFMAIYESIHSRKTSKNARIRMALIVMSTIAAVMIGYFLQLTNFFADFDPTTLGVVYAEIIILVDVKLYGLLDTMQAAQERILQDSRDGILIADSQKKYIIYANSVAKEFFPELANEHDTTIANRIFNSEEKVLERNGKHFEIRISPLTEKDETLGYVGWIFDMSFIDQYTNEMIKLKEASEQANIAKTNFLAHMSHEIRTPMNSIVGFSELALRTEESYLVKGYLKNIKDSARTLLYLINEILDISKIETGKMEITAVTYHIEDVITELRNMLETQVNKIGIMIKLQVDEDIPKYLVGDRVKIQEILTNLMNNGLKYTREGSVSLRVYVKEETEKAVLLHIEVEDTGIGIEEKNFPYVFGKFQKFDEKKNYGVEGSGLGLSIVKSFVEMMDGTITFESVYGKGTKFVIELWQGIGKGPKQPKKNKVDTNVRIKHGKVLIVDDNELNCEVAKGILECLHIESTISYSGMDCLTRLESNEKYDMILMDHMMPDMDGVETLHAVRALGGQCAELPIVLLTANVVSGVKESMLKEGFDGFLSKPIDIEELTETLAKFLGTEE